MVVFKTWFLSPVLKGGMAMRRARPTGPRMRLWAMASALALSATAVSMPVQGQVNPIGLPSLGDGDALPLGEERRIGEQITRELYRDPDWMDDAILAEYVDDLWQALLAAARQRGEISPDIDERFAWEVLLSRDRSVNAFALPGGFLGVHLGLIGVVNSRDELASVLAHELTHVTQRHISRLMTKSQQQTPLVIGTMILAAIAASKSAQAAEALAVGGQALAVQNQLNFSRDMEREADRLGFSLMAPAGFRPEGFVGMFDRLQQANRLNDNGSWPYLRSHPLTTERIADMQGRVAFQTPPKAAQAGGTAAVHAVEDALLSARARVLSKGGPDVWQQWAREPSAPGFSALPAVRQAAVLYAALLAELRLRNPNAAAARWSALDAAVHGDKRAERQVRLLKAEVAAAQGLHLEVLKWVGSGKTRPEVLLRAQALTALGQGHEAAQMLQLHVTEQPRDAGAWQALSIAREAAGQPLLALRAMAEVQMLRYDYAGAVDRFKAAQEWARQPGAKVDFVELSIIDTRLQRAQELAREQALQR